MAEILTIRIAPTFMRDYRKAGVPLQSLAEGAIKDLVRRAKSDPGGWRRLYDRVAGLSRRVLEIDLAGGPRLLAIDDGDLVLWRMGGHSLIDQVTREQPPYPETALPLPSQFLPERPIRLFPADADEGYVDYAGEGTADWAYWLDAEQYVAAESLLSAVEEAYIEGDSIVAGLFGGPGTGKTTILVWLLKQLATLESTGAALDVAIAAPTSVLNQIENSTGWDLGPFSLDVDGSPRPSDGGSPVAPDVVLVDDPGSLESLDQIFEAYPAASVIFGFDPLQMAQAITDANFADWLTQTNARTFWFQSCYRQKEVVGRAAKHVADVVAASSPFLRQDKKEKHTSERLQLTTRANDLNFVNPSGAVRTVVEPSWEDWNEYWRSIYRLRRQGRLWNHWPPLLLIVDPSADFDSRWLGRVDAVASHRCSTDDLEAVKGLEYQHVLMLLGRRLYDDIDAGFEGSGQVAYNRYRLFRIPFSRAKDSMSTFVFPDQE